MRRGTLRLADGNISFLERGERHSGRISCVLVHGILGTASNFVALMEALPPEWHLLAVDLPGAGASDRQGFATDLAAMAATNLAVIDALALERPVLLGHSHGGAVALQLATTVPQARLRGLILVAPAHPFVPEVVRIVRFHLSTAGRALAVLLPWLPLWMYQIGRGAVTERHLSQEVEVVRGYRTTLRTRGTVRFLQKLLGSWEADMQRLGQRLHRRMIPGPVLILWGDRDRVVPRSSAAELLACLPQATLSIFPETGHLPAEERPAECARLITGWLAKRENQAALSAPEHEA